MSLIYALIPYKVQVQRSQSIAKLVKGFRFAQNVFTFFEAKEAKLDFLSSIRQKQGIERNQVKYQ